MKKSNTIITDWLDKYGDPNIEKKVETKIFMEEIKRNKKINNLDKQYQQLLHDILDNGIQKSDRTGTGTLSVFGRQIRHKMSEGFPILTTKKMAFKTMVTELLWFLRGDTNIKYLVDNNCHIWDGDAYQNFQKTCQFEKDANHILPDEWISVSEDYLSANILTKEEFINKIKTDNEFAKKWGELGPIYGAQWRSWERPTPEWGVSKLKSMTIDQIQNLINELKTNPDSRRLMVSAWNVGELDQMVLPPCHYGFQVYTRELRLEERQKIFDDRGYVCDLYPFNGNWGGEYDGFGIPTRAISLMWNQRSCDFPLGIPMNIASYALLLEIIAKEVDMIPDELIGNFGDCHIYKNQIDGVKEQISREPFTNLPSVEIVERNWYQHEKVKEHLGPKSFNEKILSYRPDCFILKDYQSHPKIYFPLSN